MTRSHRLLVSLLALGMFTAIAPAQCPGVPTFTPPTPIALAPNVVAIEQGDLDGDQDRDLVVCFSGPQIQILRNAGAGAFVPETPIPGLMNVRELAVGDLNGDGRPDVAGVGTLVAQGPPGMPALLQTQLSIFLNTTPNAGAAAVTFSFPTVYPMGPLAFGGGLGRAVHTADLNADGILDIVVVDTASQGLWVLRGLGAAGVGNGAFAPPASFPLGGPGHQDAAIADLNGDGALDIAVARFGLGEVALLAGVLDAAGLPTGTFVHTGTVSMGTTDFQYSLALADLNADGASDLVVINAVDLKVAYGAGGFAFGPAVPYACGDYPYNLAVCDFSGDGVLDILAARNAPMVPGNFSVLTGQTGGGFVSYTNLHVNAGGPTSIAVADFDGDSVLDAAIGKTTGQVAVILGTCTPAVGLVVNVLSPNGGESLAAGTTTAITWSRSASVAAVDIDVTRDGGITWSPIARNVTGTSYPWLVTPAGSSQAMVRVTPAGIDAASDPSDGAFTIAGPGAAAVATVGAGCAPVGPAPFLFGVPALIGATMALGVSGATGAQPGALYVSTVPPAPTPIGSGCNIYLNLATAAQLTPFTTDATGIWVTPFAVPADVTLTGFVVRMQAIVAAPAAPLYALTNGLDVSLGF